MKKTETDIQMRFADVDVLGHVNNVNLQHYFDIGKNDFFNTVLRTGDYWQGEGIITAATSTSYIAQTRFMEPVYVETSVEKIGNKSMTVFQRLLNRHTGELKAESRSVMVAFDFDKQESIPVPKAWHDVVAG